MIEKNKGYRYAAEVLEGKIPAPMYVKKQLKEFVEGKIPFGGCHVFFDFPDGTFHARPAEKVIKTDIIEIGKPN